MTNWSTHDAPAAHQPEPPTPALVEVYWRVIGPSLKELACGLYQTAAGFELRCGYGIDDLLQSRRIGEGDSARHLAGGWLASVLEKGSFTLLESVVDDELKLVQEMLNGRKTVGR